MQSKNALDFVVVQYPNVENARAGTAAEDVGVGSRPVLLIYLEIVYCPSRIDMKRQSLNYSYLVCFYNGTNTYIQVSYDVDLKVFL